MTQITVPRALIHAAELTRALFDVAIDTPGTRLADAHLRLLVALESQEVEAR